MFSGSLSEDFLLLSSYALEKGMSGLMYQFVLLDENSNPLFDKCSEKSLLEEPQLGSLMEDIQSDIIEEQLYPESEPCRVDWIEKSAQPYNKSTFTIRQALENHHLACLSSVLLPSPPQGFAIVTFLGRNTCTALLHEQAGQTLIEASKDFHTAHYNSDDFLNFIAAPLLQKLSDTEKDLLKYMMTGKPMKLIQDYYNITPKYGEKLVRSIRHKFGNRTRAEVLYYAGILGLVRLL